MMVIMTDQMKVTEDNKNAWEEICTCPLSLVQIICNSLLLVYVNSNSKLDNCQCFMQHVAVFTCSRQLTNKS